MLRKNSVQQGSDSLLPAARCSRCLRPSASMHHATSASFAPSRRSDSNTASTNRYSTSISDRSRADEGLIDGPEPVADLADLAPRDQQFAGGVAKNRPPHPV